jgi:DUF2939 family protein
MWDRGGRIRWRVWVVLTLGILLSVYLASPLIALHNIARAVEIKDAIALTERIDFPSLRRSLTKQVVQEYLKLTGKKLPLHAIGKRVVVSMADPVVARLMTVRALLDLLGKGDAGVNAKMPVERAPFTSASFNSLWQIWLSSEYSGRSFYVYLPPKKTRSEQFIVHLHLRGWRWRIVGVDLPDDLKEQLARELVKLTQDRLNPEGSQ